MMDFFRKHKYIFDFFKKRPIIQTKRQEKSAQILNYTKNTSQKDFLYVKLLQQ